jgi:hypothetical protein
MKSYFIYKNVLYLSYYIYKKNLIFVLKPGWIHVPRKCKQFLLHMLHQSY